jgi:hypothetical protein
MWLAGAAVVAASTAVALLFRDRVTVLTKRLIAVVNAWDPTVTAAGVVIASVTWWLIVNVVLFSDFFRPIWDLAADIGTTTDLTILASAGRSTHRNHYFVSAYSVMLLGFIVWRWFPYLERRSGKSSTIWGWKLATLAVVFAFLAAAALPRRLVWERYPVVEFDNHSALVIGSAANELLVFTPDEPGRPRRRVQSDAPGLQRTGETRFLFDSSSAK